jgi:hypothetical protein
MNDPGASEAFTEAFNGTTKMSLNDFSILDADDRASFNLCVSVTL